MSFFLGEIAMHEYLECLMDYIWEKHTGKQVHASATYRKKSREASTAYKTLVSSLDGKQVETLETFCNARDAMADVERALIFQEGVALGKWMVQ